MKESRSKTFFFVLGNCFFLEGGAENSVFFSLLEEDFFPYFTPEIWGKFFDVKIF